MKKKPIILERHSRVVRPIGKCLSSKTINGALIVKCNIDKDFLESIGTLR